MPSAVVVSTFPPTERPVLTAQKRDKLPTITVKILPDINRYRAALRIILDNPHLRRLLFSGAPSCRPHRLPVAVREAIFEFTQKYFANDRSWWEAMAQKGLVEKDGPSWKKSALWEEERWENNVTSYQHIKTLKNGYEKALQAGYQEQWTCWEDIKGASMVVYDRLHKLSPLFFTIRHLYKLSKAESDPRPAKTKSRSRRLPPPTAPRSRRPLGTHPDSTIPIPKSPSSDAELSDAESSWSDLDEDPRPEAEVPLQRRQSDRIRLNAQYMVRTRYGDRRTRASGKQPRYRGMRTRSGKQREGKVEATEPEWETDLEEVEDEAEGEAEEEVDNEEGSAMWSPSVERCAAEDVGVTTRSGKKRSAMAVARESEAESEVDVSPQSSKRPRRSSSGGRSRGRVGAIDRNMEEIVKQLELQERQSAEASSSWAVRGSQRAASTKRDGSHAWVERSRILSPEVKAEDGDSEKDEVVLVESHSAKRPRPRSNYGEPSLRVEIPARNGDGAARPRAKPVEVEARRHSAKKPRVLPKIAKYAPTPPMTSATSSTPSLTRSQRDSSGSDSPLTPLPLPLPELPNTSTSPQVRPSAIDLSFTARVRASIPAHADDPASRFEYAKSYSPPVRQSDTASTTVRTSSAPTAPSAVTKVRPSAQARTCAVPPASLIATCPAEATLSIKAIDWTDSAYNEAFIDTLYTDIYTRSTLIPLPPSSSSRHADPGARKSRAGPLRQAHDARAWPGLARKGTFGEMGGKTDPGAKCWCLEGCVRMAVVALMRRRLLGAWKRGTFDLDYAAQFEPSSASPTLTEKMTFLFGAPGLLFSPTPSPAPSPKSPVSPLPLRESLPLPPPLSNTYPPVADLIDIGTCDDGSLVTEPLAGLVRRYAGWRSLPQKPVQLYPLTDAEERRLIDRYLQLDYRWRPKEEYLAKIQLAYTLEFWASRFAPSFESSLNSLGGMALLSFDSAKSIAETLLDGVIGSIAATPDVDLGGGKRRTFHRLAFSMETIGDVPLYNRLADLVYVTGARNLDQHQIRAADKFHNDLRFELHLRRSLSPNMPKVQVDGDCVHQISLFDYLIFVAQTYKLL